MLTNIIILTSVMIGSLLLLIRKDQNDGVKKLFKKQQWNVRYFVLLVLCIYGLVQMTIPVIYSEQFRLMYRRNLAAIQLAQFLVVMIFVKFFFRKKLSDLGFEHRFFEKTVYFMFYVCAPIGIILVNIILPDSFNIVSISKKVYGGTASVETIVLFLYLLFDLVLLTPIVEESLIRGIGYSVYRKKYGPTLAIIFTSVLFASFHYNSPIQAFFFGMLLGVIYEKTESFVAVVSAHAVINLTAFLYMTIAS
jgi:membrane protease YdiL (CAAX protease family)